ncbi:Tat binding protein 1-interacting protein-domain-containing protein [Gilbertella persicaria]|uniref:Tat binding protein 1-interacting protein-domain-containing protein n=1 Tax=Gilbertella persicaria TaxID=101096 RepID=UPI00221EFE0B|nr:Tat binding protein 1-interacting protein-domain-containing protein [Gilbertella persicaria]KAI8074264.1 Tat binding protein 1-interacting protein-domain-containing protein [Gilbertella persicaria]
MAKKKSSGTSKEEESAILEYLTKSNRPYSATDIFNNLHNKYSKSVIAKVLERLIDEDLVFSKTYGKTLIYSVKQAKDENGPSEQDIEKMEKSMIELDQKYEELLAENKKLEQTFSQLTSKPTTTEAEQLVEKIKAQNQILKDRLDKIKTGTVLIPPEKRKRTNEEYTRNRDLWKKRRRLFNDIFKTVTENYPGNPKELKEELGVEEDPIPFDKDPLD